MKKTILAIIIASMLGGCASTLIDTKETEAWHQREAQRTGIEQGKVVLTTRSAGIGAGW